MKLSFKIPKGVSEDDLWAVSHELHQLQLQPMKVEITKRMIHIDIGNSSDYFSTGLYVEVCQEVFNIVTQFIINNSNGE